MLVNKEQILLHAYEHRGNITLCLLDLDTETKEETHEVDATKGRGYEESCNKYL